MRVKLLFRGDVILALLKRREFGLLAWVKEERIGA
jgi:hypothetical protein